MVNGVQTPIGVTGLDVRSAGSGAGLHLHRIAQSMILTVHRAVCGYRRTGRVGRNAGPQGRGLDPVRHETHNLGLGERTVTLGDSIT